MENTEQSCGFHGRWEQLRWMERKRGEEGGTGIPP